MTKKFTIIYDNKHHIMVDIETLDTKDTAVITSIGAVKFNPTTREILAKHQWNVDDFKEQQALGRTIDIDTITWWMDQSKDAINKTFKSNNGISLKNALYEFSNFCGLDLALMNFKDIYIWGNGNMFDNAILRNAFTMYDLQYPCDFRNDLDLRTIKWLFKDSDIKTESVGTKHNAVDDAEYQVDVLCDLIHSIK